MNIKKAFLALAITMATFVSNPGRAADVDPATKERILKIVELKEKGLVGEQPDGLLGVIKDEPGVKTVVDAENAYRMSEYTKRATEQGTPLDVFMQVLGEAKIRKEDPGRMVRSATGDWTKKK